ncbi:aspartate/glutamate racemase family protein [Oscillibacter hominis]|uniref:Aspartate/glutamate racemase family protein n=1 Tax=Oscillibacter hominis TaxID=2763056 RepID=A0A7G9B376_9FIRM|nr:amino acid racemase [Oscillibacter hominis]QNL44007.1 aspartate/glutamate racemase family protein [Oscillibacter hominis]
MKKTIGIIGGMGPLATADLFRKIVLMTDAASDNDHIRIFIDDNTAIPDRTLAILSGGADPVEAMADSIRKLEQCGADCLIMPCNTAHYFLPRLRPLTGIPFLSMLEATAKACAAAFPGKTAGVLATRGTLSSGVYERALQSEGVDYLLPEEEDRDRLMQVIYKGVKKGAPIESVRGPMEEVLNHMSGADYFILGCTELPIAAEGLALPQRFVDPTAELAKAAIRFCGYQVKDPVQ